MSKSYKASILIPSTRPEDLKRCLESIDKQTFRDFEVIVNDERGPLSKIRNKLAREATGEILCFIDDDTVVSEGWLQSIVTAFGPNFSKVPGQLAGVSGPAPLGGHTRNRDIFKFRWAKYLYDRLFCDGKAHLPGHITKAGAWTTGACKDDCDYEGEVMFLEACNMAFRADLFWEVGGFDESYGGVGEWSEPDVCYKLRRKGYLLRFDAKVKLLHFPSKSGCYVERLKTKSRWENYERFWKRWVQPCWQHSLYKRFVRSYFEMKGLGWL